MAIDPRRHLGDIGEQLALEHLERLGYELITRNHRTRWGEIDLVVHDGRSLVFVEVKTRRASSEGRGPWEALHGPKQRQVRRMAAAYLAEVSERPRAAELRFDAIGVVIDPRGHLVALDHVEAAF
jgi:putative endonuclease